MKHTTFSTAHIKKSNFLKGVQGFVGLSLVIISAITFQACNSSDCDKMFVKKVTSTMGVAFQTDTLPIQNLKNPAIGSLSFFAYNNLNGEIKLSFVSSSDQRHFSNENGDSLLVIYFGSTVRHTLTRYLVQGNKEPGAKFIATTSFRMDEAITSDIVKNKNENQFRFVLGTYDFVLNDEMYCTLKQMLKSNLTPGNK